MVRQLTVLVDFAEEGWTSMDLCAEMLIRHLGCQGVIRPVRFSPAFRERAQRLPGRRIRGSLFNLDRAINRFWDYPRASRRLGGEPDFFHICDHSYSQMVHGLPVHRTGVYCHDLIAFRSVLDPRAEPRPFWFRSMMRHVFEGMCKARLIFCSTEILRRQIEDTGRVDPGRIVLAPFGVSEEFCPEPNEADASLPLPFDPAYPFLLHVGTTIPRKRIDVLLDTFGRARSRVPGVRLVQVGGRWTDGQWEQIRRLGIADKIVQLRGLGGETLAALYRRAAVVLLPSEEEGFGLPLIEALACGAIVVASDIEVFREVGGEAPLFAPVGDPYAWAEIVVDLLEGRIAPPDRAMRLSQASRYSWAAHAQTIAEAYLRLL
jgi:glycosyltransferase involved in cell wall biosynthesis